MKSLALNEVHITYPADLPPLSTLQGIHVWQAVYVSIHAM